MKSFSDYLDISLKHMPRLLINEDNKERLLSLAEYLPDLFAHFLFGYEKKLIDDGKMDMSVSALKRRLKYPVMRDVAGVLRSFHYAVYSVFFQRSKTVLKMLLFCSPGLNPGITTLPALFLILIWK